VSEKSRAVRGVNQTLKDIIMSIELALKALGGIETKLEKIGLDQRELAERLMNVEQRSTRGPNDLVLRGDGHATQTLGDQLVEQLTKSENTDLLAKTKSLRFELKAAGDPLTTSNGRTVMSGGVGAPGAGVVGIQTGLAQRGVGSISAYEYSRFTGTVEGAAAQQATEGAAKAALRPVHTLIQQTALTIAGYTKMSRQALSDSAELKRAVDITLTREVGKALDVALVTGATGFTGGLAGLAAAYTSLVYTRLIDATSEAVATMQTMGFSPDMVAMNPADWLAITVAQGSDGHYLSGNYLGLADERMRNLRVVLSPTVAAGKSLVMDSAHTELLIVGPFAIEVAYDSDDFTKNLVTVLGETRVIPVFRTAGSARLITPKAP
jgi:hypothetical protein